MKIIHTETRQAFAHFLTSYVSQTPLSIRLTPASTCAIIGGVLTVAGLIDSFIFSSAKRLKGEGDGIAGPRGKLVSYRSFEVRHS